MWPGRDAVPSPPSSAEVKNRVDAIPLLSVRAFVAYDRVKPNLTNCPKTYSILSNYDPNFFSMNIPSFKMVCVLKLEGVVNTEQYATKLRFLLNQQAG